MGYLWQGVCYQDTASALVAFTKSASSIDGTGINTPTAAPTITGAGLVSWSISNRSLTSNNVNTRTGTTQLLACSSPTPDQWPMQSYAIYIALFFAFVAGFRTGFR